MSRNKMMAGLAAVSTGLLLAGVLRTYRVFSYLAALFIVATIAVSSLERSDSEFDLSPYGGLVGGLIALFLVGLTGIWLLWSPGVTEYTYVLGLPLPTMVYVVFIWLLPIAGTLYYAAVFPDIGSDEVVTDIMTAAAQAQEEREFPLSPERPTAASDSDRVGADPTETDGGRSR